MLSQTSTPLNRSCSTRTNPHQGEAWNPSTVAMARTRGRIKQEWAMSTDLNRLAATKVMSGFFKSKSSQLSKYAIDIASIHPRPGGPLPVEGSSVEGSSAASDMTEL